MRRLQTGLQPVNEAQIRPLTKLENAEAQVEAWEMAVETAPDGKVTAKKHVSAVLNLSGVRDGSLGVSRE